MTQVLNTPDAISANYGLNENKDELLRQIAVLLQVARKEWPQQSEGTEWDRKVQAVLQQYRALREPHGREGERRNDY